MKRMIRSRTDRVLAGVCGGFGDYFGLDPALIRLVWIFFSLFGGSGILAYILAVVVIPDGPETASRSDSENGESGNRLLWGILLVIVGLVLFFQHSELVRMVWHRFWGSGFNVLISLAILGYGIYLIYSQRKKLPGFLEMGPHTPFHLSVEDKKLSGLCGGIGESLQIDSTVVRFLWAFGTLMSAGLGVVLYVILSLLLPETPDLEQESTK